MKILILAFLFSVSAQARPSSQGGSEGTGGGDACEQRIQEIRDDLKSWIAKGGPKRFVNIPVSSEEYSTRMSAYLAVESLSSGAYKPATKIECVHRSIEVQGVEKTCRFDRFSSGPQITCNAVALMDKRTMGVDEQYKIIHHEFAGLAGLEAPSASQSSYIYSNQISAFLANQVVKKLAVKEVPATDDSKLKAYKEATIAAMPLQWLSCQNFGQNFYVRNYIMGAQSVQFIDGSEPKLVFNTYDTSTGHRFDFYKIEVSMDPTYKKVTYIQFTAYNEGIVNDGDLRSPAPRKGLIPTAKCSLGGIY
jgi:hypothetical protein